MTAETRNAVTQPTLRAPDPAPTVASAVSAASVMSVPDAAASQSAPAAEPASAARPSSAGTPPSPQGPPVDSGWAAAATAIVSLRAMEMPLIMRITAIGHEPILIDPRHNAYTGGPSSDDFPADPRRVLVETQLIGPDTPPAFELPAGDLDALLWRIGLLAFPDGNAPWLTGVQKLRLRRWPNLTALNCTFEQVSMAALLANGGFTPQELAEASGASLQDARSLINALSLIGLLQTDTVAEESRAEPSPAAEASPAVTAAAATEQAAAASITTANISTADVPTAAAGADPAPSPARARSHVSAGHTGTRDSGLPAGRRDDADRVARTRDEASVAIDTPPVRTLTRPATRPTHSLLSRLRVRFGI